MKKILEVLQFGDMGIKFNTDIDVLNDPSIVSNVVINSALTMMTTLWGGNELSGLAMLRALTIADLALSVNRKEMIQWLDDESAALCRTLQEDKKEFERQGGSVTTFPPGVMPPKMPS